MEASIKKIEDKSLNAWPSHKMELYDGWILRFSYFYTHRTNSVEQFGTSTLPWREKIPYCEQVYKRLGTPAIFKISPLVSPDFDYMLEKSENFGIKREQICLDMGIGFGKDYEDNLTLIKNIKRLKRQDVMLLTALSNKRVIKAASHSDAENCLFGTIAADTAAVFGGTDMIRVHEVKESKIAADMADAVFRG